MIEPMTISVITRNRGSRCRSYRRTMELERGEVTDHVIPGKPGRLLTARLFDNCAFDGRVELGGFDDPVAVEIRFRIGKGGDNCGREYTAALLGRFMRQFPGLRG